MGEPIECQNGTWSQIPRCVAARCKTMPTPPHNGMIVAPSLNHGATGLYTCKVGVQLQCCGAVVMWCCGVSTPAAQNINYCSSINLCPGHHLSRLLSGWVRAAGGGEDHLCVRQLVRADPLLPGAVLQLPRIPGQRQGGRGGRTLVITSC